MRILEKESARRTRKSKIQKAILGVVAAAGILAVAAVAPNALQALSIFGFGRSNKYPKNTVNRSFNRLIEGGLLKIERTENGNFVGLTVKGEKLMRLWGANNYQIKKPKRWDGKFRVIIFDIKEYRKGIRNKLRKTLQSIGFIKLQNSVWVYPYDCEDYIKLIKADFHIGKDALYMIVDNIENDKPIKKVFGLK